MEHLSKYTNNCQKHRKTTCCSRFAWAAKNCVPGTWDQWESNKDLPADIAEVFAAHLCHCWGGSFGATWAPVIETPEEPSSRNRELRCYAKAGSKSKMGRSTYIIYYWLVVWNMICIFSISWECHHPNWLSYFSDGLKPPTSYGQHTGKQQSISCINQRMWD